MRTIKVKKDTSFYFKDCQRIQNILIDKGYYATLDQCQELWEMYSSNEYAASWLIMNDVSDEEIYYSIKKYFQEDAIVDG